MKYLFILEDGSAWCKETVTHEDRLQVQDGIMDIFQFDEDEQEFKYLTLNKVLGELEWKIMETVEEPNVES